MNNLYAAARAAFVLVACIAFPAAFAQRSGMGPPADLLQRAGAPQVLSQWASQVTPDSAVLAARLNNLNSQSIVRFQVAANLEFNGALETAAIATGPMANVFHVNLPIGNLKPETAYFFRCIVSSAFGTTVGPVAAFSTANGHAR